jgi:hypothetical protein
MERLVRAGEINYYERCEINYYERYEEPTWSPGNALAATASCHVK